MPKMKLKTTRGTRGYNPMGDSSNSKSSTGSKSRDRQEARDERGEHTKRSGSDITQTNWKSVHQSSAKTGFEIIYGFSPDVYLKSENTGKINTMFARDWWERAGAVSQCENVIGKFVNDTECYICGLPIEIDDNKKEFKVTLTIPQK